MSAALDFDTLSQLAGNKALSDVSCPRCGPERSTRATQRKPVLRIWRVAPDFLTYSCARCSAHGHASARHGALVDRRELSRRLRAANKHQAAAESERRSRARWLWGMSHPIADTIAETYLRNRGITIIPPTLRFLPARSGHPPAMIAAFGLGIEPEPGRYEIGRAAVHAVHLTRLLPDGSGKAPDAEGRTKVMVGVTEGWPLALIPPNDAGGLAISEGIEDALSLHQATGLGCWAAGAAVRLPRLACLIARLAYTESLLIAQDDDPVGRRGAAELAAELQRSCGCETRIIELGEGCS